MNNVGDIFLGRLPSIDLHGFDRESARVAINDFILENMFLNNKELLIIHGIGQGIIKNTVLNELSRNNNILEYKIVNNNVGVMYVKLR